MFSPKDQSARRGYNGGRWMPDQARHDVLGRVWLWTMVSWLVGTDAREQTLLGKRSEE